VMEGGVSNGSKDVDEIDSCHLKEHGAKVSIACAQSESDACTGGVRESMSARHKPPQSPRFFGAHEFGLHGQCTMVPDAHACGLATRCIQRAARTVQWHTKAHGQ